MHVEYDNSDYQSSIDFITYGQVFLYCGVPYIKTDKVGNAVNLLDGREKGFAEGILVEPVKAKVVIQHLDLMEVKFKENNDNKKALSKT